MEKISKELKKLSKAIGFIGLYQVFNMITMYIGLKTLNVEDVAADPMTQKYMPVVVVLSMLPLVLSILVHVYLCVKGHTEANDPSPAKFHIVLSILWALGYAFSTITEIANVFTSFSVLNLANTLVSAAATVLMFLYFKYAKENRTVDN